MNAERVTHFLLATQVSGTELWQLDSSSPWGGDGFLVLRTDEFLPIAKFLLAHVPPEQKAEAELVTKEPVVAEKRRK